MSTPAPAPVALEGLPQSLRHQLTSGRKLTTRRRKPSADELFPSGLSTVDRLLEGGIVRGELFEIVGRASSGRFSLTLAFLAQATRRGEAAALVDLGDHFDPRSAQEKSDIDLSRLLWIRPTKSRDALAAAEILMSAELPLVAIDLGHPPVPGGRGAEAHWLRLARTALRYRTALLVSAPYRVSGTAAEGVLEPRGRRALWHAPRPRAPRLLTGLVPRLTLNKSRRLRSAGGATSDLVLRLFPELPTFEATVGSSPSSSLPPFHEIAQA